MNIGPAQSIELIWSEKTAGREGPLGCSGRGTQNLEIGNGVRVAFYNIADYLEFRSAATSLNRVTIRTGTCCIVQSGLDYLFLNEMRLHKCRRALRYFWSLYFR
jgi:hypothetical protein